MDLVVDLNSYSDTVTLSYTEAACKSHFILKAMLLYRFLKKLHDFRRAFQVTGAAYADLYYHHILVFTSFSKKSVTVSGVTEKNSSPMVTQTPCWHLPM